MKLKQTCGGIEVRVCSRWRRRLGRITRLRRNSTPRKPVHLEGVLTKVELINPHSWIHVDVTEPDGQVTSWMVEAGSPNVLLRRGFQ